MWSPDPESGFQVTTIEPDVSATLTDVIDPAGHGNKVHWVAGASGWTAGAALLDAALPMAPTPNAAVPATMKPATVARERRRGGGKSLPQADAVGRIVAWMMIR